jgi:hypothetical protein
MIKLALFVVLSATAAHSVQAGDTKDSLRDIMDFCNQFVIRDPDAGIRLDYHHYDCFFVTTQVSLSRALEFGDEPFWVCGEGVEHIPTLFFRR